jgi:hypothetical protein
LHDLSFDVDAHLWKRGIVDRSLNAADSLFNAFEPFLGERKHIPRFIRHQSFRSLERRFEPT